MNLSEVLKYKFNKKYYNWKINKYIKKEPESIIAFENTIKLYSNQNCYLHGGYKAINSFFRNDGGFDRLIKILDNNFNNILSPAYTLSFKKNGVFHHKFSKPDIGQFGLIFEKYADFRSFDPIGSIWFRGSIDKSKYDLVNSFLASNSLYSFIDNNKSVTISLGTGVIRLAHLHYLEQKYNLPYRKQVTYNGVIYYDEKSYEKIEHKTTENIGTLQVERERLEYDLLREGVLHRHDFGKLVLRIINNEDFANFIRKKTEINPYYLFFENTPV